MESAQRDLGNHGKVVAVAPSGFVVQDATFGGFQPVSHEDIVGLRRPIRRVSMVCECPHMAALRTRTTVASLLGPVTERTGQAQAIGGQSIPDRVVPGRPRALGTFGAVPAKPDVEITSHDDLRATTILKQDSKVADRTMESRFGIYPASISVPYAIQAHSGELLAI